MNREWKEAEVCDVLRGTVMVVRTGEPAEYKRILLAHIKAPACTAVGNQREEPGGFLAREFVRKMCIGKKVRYLVAVANKRSDEFVTVMVDNVCLNEELVRCGWATHIGAKPPKKVLDWESAAAEGKLGIHGDNLPCRKALAPSSDALRSFVEEKRDVPMLCVVDRVHSAAVMEITVLETLESLRITLFGVDAEELKVYHAGNSVANRAKGRVEDIALCRDVMVCLKHLDAHGCYATVSVNGEDLAKTLISESLVTAQENTGVGQEYVVDLKEMIAESRPHTEWQRWNKEARSMRAVVTDAEEGTRFFYMVPALKLQDIDGISKKLKHAVDEDYADAPITEDDTLVCAQLEDGKWHRATICSWSEDKSSAEVFFIDFGTKHTVPASMIHRIPPTVNTGHALAIKAALAYVELPLGTEHEKTAAQYFKYLTGPGNTLTAITEYTEDDICYVTLVDKGEDSILNVEMVAEGLAKWADDAPRFTANKDKLMPLLKEAQEDAMDSHFNIWA